MCWAYLDFVVCIALNDDEIKYETQHRGSIAKQAVIRTGDGKTAQKGYEDGNNTFEQHRSHNLSSMSFQFYTITPNLP